MMDTEEQFREEAMGVLMDLGIPEDEAEREIDDYLEFTGLEDDESDLFDDI